MSDLKALSVEELYQRCDPALLDFETTDELEDLSEVIGQERAIGALHFGVGIRKKGYNLYVLGPPGLGKHNVVKTYLQTKAAEAPAPADWCYVNDFDDPNRPRALRLPAGRGAALRRDMHHLVEDLLSAIPAAFDAEEYQARAKELEKEFHERQEKALGELQERAQAQHIALLRTPGGFAFAPMRDEEVMSPEEFAKLPEDEQKTLESQVGELQEELQKVLRQVPQWRKETRDKLKALNQETTLLAVGHEIDALRESYVEFPEVLAFLDAVQQDIVENVDDFRNQEEVPENQLGRAAMREPAFRRYQVNVIIDHDEETAAPVVYENNPTHDNLVGRIEHLAQMGTLVTDFMLIKSGALHRANGGYLILDAQKVLTQPFVWEALKRALFAEQIRIESLGQMLSVISTVSLEPEPIPLDVKIVLLGDRMLYYLLYEYDPEFGELFKVAADFEEQIDRSPENTRLYARMLATVARQEKLQPFDRGAVARLIEHAARRVEDTEKMSTHMSGIADLLREADHWASQAGRSSVTTADVDHAITQQIYRAGRIQQRLQEAIRRGTLLIDSEGQQVGQVNGLTIIELGGFLFGHPTRITATARLGEGEVVDIEREVELGGASHSKGVLILSSFLSARYALDRPLSLVASLVFEQSYGYVDGDSASMAELCALLSVLADVPVRQSFAVTGSVNQLGHVQPIGGVNEKIEGFFDVCKARGLTGEQGVIIPSTNVKHLMLREDVREAAEQGQFAIYAVETVDEAIALLTGLPAGERGEEGKFAEGSVNRRVEDRLLEFSELRQEFGEHDKGKLEVKIDSEGEVTEVGQDGDEPDGRDG
ncbi:MAG: ATP-binding protein [Gammaproteobacteria bacterium]